MSRIDTYSFEWSEHAISNDFSASSGGEETDSLVLSCLGAKGSLVNVLEHLVETELSEALARVTHKGCVPSEGESLGALSSVDSLESVGDALVESRVNLNINFGLVSLYVWSGFAPKRYLI